MTQAQAQAQSAIPGEDQSPQFDLETMNRELESLSAEQRVGWALERYPGRVVLTSSFGAQSAVCLHMVVSQQADIPVVLVDTGYLFPETYRFIDELSEQLSLNLRIYRAELSPELARQTTDDPLALSDDGEPGVKLLANVIAVLRANPQLTTAALLERYRDTREGAILERLAAWEPGVPEQDYRFEEEFGDILASLGRRDDLRERLPDILLRRGSPRALSVEEREAVGNLGKAKKV